MKRHNNTRTADTAYVDNVIDLASRRRGHLERRGADPLAVAVALVAETGHLPVWDLDTTDDDGGWAA
ncbi:hypothetical protein [Nocardia takedensis]|uniref:hypothetical protein n=1 Tax=Nocardia takedensis TaxID=259390 RepID=UPI0002DCEC75|nr:hypothetical protein [Nocardia takedensis]